ncbi:hypothetical protein BFU36_05785 [Sulfolobus sp. A20]|uniref:hypothetical protein n=1 Tax=Saccharolobus sp. A20 TaxID=1891280 RepID=UPI00084621AF|nr:hypothetical protein [Sulfolobus sp. A20]AOL16293.1 hypothetical protein BFU36_05785 [Sulfolobus sp. A20]TRM87640.1 hypothetical protein DJ521_03240 [Sulfolobus sp. E3]TRM89778.1 hypothetical protein DJ529_00825 [Sulfolobus sp. C3]TRN04204.1 hypothetical protein DJ530_01100 [Sulfolobus sp. E1]
MLVYFKPVKNEKNIHIALEIVSELFASKIAKILNLPILDVTLTKFKNSMGLLMDYLPEKADQRISNIAEIRKSLAFEEWILNIDLKEEHVLAKENKGYIIDHGHAISAWKPLYYIAQIIDKRVTRFNLWAEEEDFSEGIELVKSIDNKTIKELLRESFSEVQEANFCKLFTGQVAEEYFDLSLRLLEKRASILESIKNTIYQ